MRDSHTGEKKSYPNWGSSVNRLFFSMPNETVTLSLSDECLKAEQDSSPRKSAADALQVQKHSAALQTPQSNVLAFHFCPLPCFRNSAEMSV